MRKICIFCHYELIAVALLEIFPFIERTTVAKLRTVAFFEALRTSMFLKLINQKNKTYYKQRRREYPVQKKQ